MMKFGPLMPKKEKKEKPTVDQQIMEAGVRLRALKRKYEVILERELRALRYSKEKNRENPKATANIKNAYFCLTVVAKVQDRLREITSLQELAKAMNEMSAVIKLVNGVEGKTEKVNTRALNSGMKKMEKNGEKSGGGMPNYFAQPLDELVPDDIIDRLIKGEALEQCLDESEYAMPDLSDVEPIMGDPEGGNDLLLDDFSDILEGIEESGRDL